MLGKVELLQEGLQIALTSSTKSEDRVVNSLKEHNLVDSGSETPSAASSHSDMYRDSHLAFRISLPRHHEQCEVCEEVARESKYEILKSQNIMNK